jgi:hypothetical protein
MDGCTIDTFSYIVKKDEVTALEVLIHMSYIGFSNMLEVLIFQHCRNIQHAPKRLFFLLDLNFISSHQN